MTTKIPAELSSTPSITDAGTASIDISGSSDPIFKMQGSGHPQLRLKTTGTTDNTSIDFGDSDSETRGRVLYNHNDDRLSLTVGASERARFLNNNLHLNGGTDARIQLGSGGAGANSTSNDTVHVRGDGDDLKLMMAADGQMVIEQNGAERLRLNALGVLSNKSANNILRTEAQSFLTLGDDSSVTLFLGSAGSTLLSVYEGASGSGAIVWLNYSESSGGNFIKSGGSLNFSSSDTDGQICVIKSANSHTATLKNRTGVARNFAIAMYGAKIDSSNS